MSWSDENSGHESYAGKAVSEKIVRESKRKDGKEERASSLTK